MVSITSIILLIAKGYSTGVRIIYKRSSRVKDIITLKLPKVIRGIIGLYKTFLNLY